MQTVKKIKEKQKGLHPVIAILILISLSGIIAWGYGEKTYNVTDTANGWVKEYNGIEYTKQQIKYSDMPSKTATFVIDSILQPIQDKILKQVNPLLVAEQKRIQDSVNKIKPKN